MADEQKAIDFLTDKAKDAAKGLAEESEVYRVAENIVEDNKALFGTVNAILNKELGVSFDVGKDKEVGFMLSPEEKKAELGFKMKFAEEGLVGQSGLGFISREGLTIDEAIKLAIKEVPTEEKVYNTARKQLTEIFDEIYGKPLNKIKLTDIDVKTAAKFIQAMNTKGHGEKTIEKFGALFQYGTDVEVNPIDKIKKTKGMYRSLYPRAEEFTGTYLQRWDNKAHKAYKSLLEFTDNLSPTLVPKSVNGSLNRLMKIQLLTGIHTADLVRLRPTDFDEQGFIRFLSAKKGPLGDPIPISDEVVKLIKEQLAEVNTLKNGGVKNFGGRIFGLKGSSTNINNLQKITSAEAKAYNDSFNTQYRASGLKDKIKIYDGSIKGERALTIKDARSYHANKLKLIGESGVANESLGWTRGKDEASRMFKEVYSRTADDQLKVDLTQENFKNLKTVVNKKQNKIAELTGYKFTKIDISKVASEVDELKGQDLIPDKIKQPVVTEAPKPVVTETPKPVVEGTELKIEKVEEPLKKRRLFSKAKLANILSKGSKALKIMLPLQIANQMLGGEEGLYKDRLFGVFAPTVSQDVEETVQLGRDIGSFVQGKSQDEQMNELMPEETGTFEQQGGL
jgi:integrase